MTPMLRDFDVGTATPLYRDEPQLDECKDVETIIKPSKQKYIKTKSGMTYPKRNRF